MLQNKTSLLLRKNAVITGGTRGIGLAIAEEFVKLGAKIIICSRTKTDIQKALLKLNEKEKVAFGVICDISKFDDCKKLIKFTQKKLGKIDILINNAGIYGPIGPFQKLNLIEWKKTFDINLMGMVYLSYLIIPLMEKSKGGKIINLCGAGVGGNKTMPRFSAYFTAKSALNGFTELIADELQEKNIQVNAIAPGFVRTDFSKPFWSSPEVCEQIVKHIPAGRIAETVDLVPIVLLLASGYSDYITGQTIMVDGGASAI